MDSHPQSVEPAEIRGRIEAFTRALHHVSKAFTLQGSLVVTEMCERFNEWDSMLPTLAHLSNPKLTDKHWESVIGLFMLNVMPSEITVGKLHQNQVFDAANLCEIATISAAASAEAGADAAVDCVIKSWDHRELNVTLASTKLEIWVLADQAELKFSFAV